MLVKLRMILDIEYDSKGVPPEELKENLTQLVEGAYSEGLITKSSEAEISKFHVIIEEPDKVLRIGWTTGDVIDCAEEDGISLSEEEAIAVLKRVKHGHDCEIGINWDVIKNAIHFKS